MYLFDHFDLSLLDDDVGRYNLALRQVSQPDDFSNTFSYVRNQTIANILNIPCGVSDITLHRGMKILVVQYKGPELSSNATRLPEGGEFIWWEVFID